MRIRNRPYQDFQCQIGSKALIWLAGSGRIPDFMNMVFDSRFGLEIPLLPLMQTKNDDSRYEFFVVRCLVHWERIVNGTSSTGEPCQRCSGSFSDFGRARSKANFAQSVIRSGNSLVFIYLPDMAKSAGYPAKPDRGRVSGRLLLKRCVFGTKVGRCFYNLPCKI